MRMVGYGRVSTDHEEQRDSLEHQQAFFQDFARARGHTLVRVYADATCIIGTNQSPSKRAAICPCFSYFQSIWRRHTL